jgi:hypothetical protein
MQSIGFTDEGVVVTYIEEEEFDLQIPMLQQLSIPGEPFKLEIDELIASARELVDAALLARRNPPATFVANR